MSEEPSRWREAKEELGNPDDLSLQGKEFKVDGGSRPSMTEEEIAAANASHEDWALDKKIERDVRKNVDSAERDRNAA